MNMANMCNLLHSERDTGYIGSNIRVLAVGTPAVAARLPEVESAPVEDLESPVVKIVRALQCIVVRMHNCTRQEDNVDMEETGKGHKDAEPGFYNKVVLVSSC
jgi:hypothetical protein